MRMLMVTGNLAADPELKTSKAGNNFYNLRVASNEYNEKEPMWVRCTCFEASMFSLIKTMKKGSGVIITGDYSQTLYYSTKNNCSVIDNDLIIRSIGYLPYGKQADQNTQQVQQPQGVVQPQSTVQAQKVIQTQNVAQPQIAAIAVQTTPNETWATGSMDDDLPF